MALRRLTFAISLSIALGSMVLPARSAQEPPPPLGLVPKPVSLETRPGSFALTKECRILYQQGSADAKATAHVLAKTLRDGAGLSLRVREASPEPGANTLLLTTANADPKLGDEGYLLEVTPTGVIIRASRAAGLFYGVQTLHQLLPAETFGTTSVVHSSSLSLPCVRISDQPRFGWRGMHLDVSRHFFDTSFVKRYIDNLAALKMNVFHWHLSDDDGWRVEIKKYPRLTKVAAWRGPNEALPPSYESGNQRYGGFYTQKQIREIVRYAAERHVRVVPEVDVPAHCRAVTVAYPELLCTGDPYKFKSVQDVPANVLCPSQEKTYEFLEGVFGELAELFPGAYLHAGGDERPPGPWEQCDRCRKRMQDEHLANGSLLQDRFLKRLQGIIRAHGRLMIGWDELEQESVLDKDYMVMAWNKVETGIAAAQKGYPVLVTASPFNYLDLSYNEDPAEPGLRWAGVISVEKTYSLDPKPASLPPEIAARIRGVHGALWAEMLVTPDRPDYMLFPRICALAEVGWTPQAQRSWPEFWTRLCSYHFPRLDAAGVAYRIPLPTARRTGNEITVALPYENAEVRYTLDGSEPTLSSPRCQGPVLAAEGVVFKMRTFRPNRRASRTVTLEESVKFGP
jgi:hexosaminidase